MSDEAWISRHPVHSWSPHHLVTSESDITSSPMYMKNRRALQARRFSQVRVSGPGQEGRRVTI
jgi:hypothetical protein